MMTQKEAQELIIKECDALKELLLSKNQAYGNAALEPVRAFSDANSSEQIRVRIDDKISRLARGNPKSMDKEDVVQDLLGYLILLRIAEKKDGGALTRLNPDS